MNPPIRIATRQSPLALWQAEHVASLLLKSGVASTLVPLVSSGDVDMTPIDGTRQVGVFTKRIQQALIDDEADVAVHSLKDLPTEPDDRLQLAAIPERETVLDALVSPSGMSISEVPIGARIGTGSCRRAAQLMSMRPDLKVLPIRGNVQTRLAKLDSGEFDAIMLAEAGILRLEMQSLKRYRFSLEEMLPAPGQGALGIEVRTRDDRAKDAIKQLDHRPTRLAVTAERGLLAALHGGCLAPIAAHASLEADQLKMSAVVLSPSGDQRMEEQAAVSADDDQAAESLAASISQVLIGRGAIELIGRLDGGSDRH